MLLILYIIEIMTLKNVEILHAVFLWTINDMEFFTVIFFYVAGEKLVQVLNFYFLLLSALALLRFKKFVLIVFL